MNDRGLHDLTEDTTGFGRADLRTCIDSLLRPRQVLEVYMTAGPDGGGLYARPLKLYLVLCGVMMLVLFLMGGADGLLASYPPEMIAPLVAASGKSGDAFMADFDGWISLTLVPILAVFYALAVAPFLRWWDGEDLGWRRAFRAGFALLNAWTLPLLPICWMFYMPAFAGWGMLAMTVVLVITFLRMGPGRWYGSVLGGVLKSLCLMLAVFVMSSLGTIPVIAIGLLGGRFGP
jgi:hypothetical protein